MKMKIKYLDVVQAIEGKQSHRERPDTVFVMLWPWEKQTSRNCHTNWFLHWVNSSVLSSNRTHLLFFCPTTILSHFPCHSKFAYNPIDEVACTIMMHVRFLWGLYVESVLSIHSLATAVMSVELTFWMRIHGSAVWWCYLWHHYYVALLLLACQHSGTRAGWWVAVLVLLLPTASCTVWRWCTSQRLTHSLRVSTLPLHYMLVTLGIFQHHHHVDLNLPPP